MTPDFSDSQWRSAFYGDNPEVTIYLDPFPGENEQFLAIRGDICRDNLDKRGGDRLNRSTIGCNRSQDNPGVLNFAEKKLFAVSDETLFGRTIVGKLDNIGELDPTRKCEQMKGKS
jgi:hypothetical protein